LRDKIVSKEIASKGTTILLASHLLDEVEKVCSHVVVIRKGIKLYSGRVDEMTASKGLFELKVDTNEDKLIEVLQSHDAIGKVSKDHETFIATLSNSISASEMNKYLFENGITVSHLVKRKPSLEQQFLDLTNNN
jgi:ABC-2 type transport system ATP-binding protein